MKRDWDTIREILIALEEREGPSPMTLSDFPDKKSDEISLLSDSREVRHISVNQDSKKSIAGNATNEIAVAGFLAGRLRFDQIHAVNAATLEQLVFDAPRSLDDLFELDALSRRCAQRIMAELSR